MYYHPSSPLAENNETTANQPRSWTEEIGRQATRVALYLVYLVIVVLLIIYFFIYKPFISTIVSIGETPPRIDGVRHVSPRTFLRLGSVHPSSNNHFVHFDQTKKPGVFRICALGDSISAGAEVGPNHNYTAYLQRELENIGADNVEVINFANSWFGFSQVAIMWHEVASKFECDLLLLLVYGFWWERDTTFNHTNFMQPYYLHARYIVDHGELRLIEVLGNTYQERFNRYFGFFPSWRYLRYDRHTPAIVQAMVPKSKRIPNPLYYRSSAWNDAMRVHRALMSSIASSGLPMVVMSDVGDGTLDALMKDQYPNVTFASQIREGFKPGDFPYWAPIFHETAWGHQVMARRFLRILVSDGFAPIPVLTLNDLPAQKTWETPPALNASRSITVNTADGAIGALVSIHDREVEREHRHRAALADSPTTGLLTFRAPGESFLNGCLLPLREPLPPGSRVLVTLPDGNSIDLGETRLVAPGVAIWVVDRPNVNCWLHGPLSFQVSGGHGRATLVAGPNSMEGRLHDGTLFLGERNQQMYRMRGLGQFLADATKIPETGSLTLVTDGDVAGGIEISQWSLLHDYLDLQILRDSGIGLRVRSGSAEIAD